jgi:hypothetical protein
MYEAVHGSSAAQRAAAEAQSTGETIDEQLLRAGRAAVEAGVGAHSKGGLLSRKAALRAERARLDEEEAALLQLEGYAEVGLGQREEETRPAVTAAHLSGGGAYGGGAHYEREQGYRADGGYEDDSGRDVNYDGGGRGRATSPTAGATTAAAAVVAVAAAATATRVATAAAARTTVLMEATVVAATTAAAAPGTGGVGGHRSWNDRTLGTTSQ